MTTVATGQVLLAGTSPAGLAASFAALHVVSQRARVLRLRRTGQPLAYNVTAVLPSSTRNGVGILIHRLFEAQSPGPPMPLSTLRVTPRDDTRKTRGQDGFATSFPLGLFHPLQHAGLARRTPV